LSLGADIEAATRVGIRLGVVDAPVALLRHQPPRRLAPEVGELVGRVAELHHEAGRGESLLGLDRLVPPEDDRAVADEGSATRRDRL
jgi:hypothetical protein